MTLRYIITNLAVACTTALGMDNGTTIETKGDGNPLVTMIKEEGDSFEFGNFHGGRFDPKKALQNFLTITSEKSRGDETGEKEKQAGQKLNGSFYFISDDDDLKDNQKESSLIPLEKNGASSLPEIHEEKNPENQSSDLPDQDGYQYEERKDVNGFYLSNKSFQYITDTRKKGNVFKFGINFGGKNSQTNTENSGQEKKGGSLNLFSPQKDNKGLDSLEPIRKVRNNVSLYLDETPRTPFFEIHKGFLPGEAKGDSKAIAINVYDKRGKVCIFEGSHIMKLPLEDRSFFLNKTKDAKKIIFLARGTKQEKELNEILDTDDKDFFKIHLLLKKTEKSSENIEFINEITEITETYADGDSSKLRYLTLAKDHNKTPPFEQ